MNIQHLRQSVKAQWLDYYRQNREWLNRLGVWITHDGKRRPSSSFILATLTTLEPQLTELLPLIVDLTGNPDRIIAALGLNFNPDDELKELERTEKKTTNGQVKMLPSQPTFVEVVVTSPTHREAAPLATTTTASNPKATERPAKQSIEKSVENRVKKRTQSALEPSGEKNIVQDVGQNPTENTHNRATEIESPFSVPDSPFDEEPEATDAPSFSSGDRAPNLTATQPIIRPALDIQELSAQEQPKREPAPAAAPTVPRKTHWD